MEELPRAFDDGWKALGEAEDRTVGMVMDDDMVRVDGMTDQAVRQDKKRQDETGIGQR